MPVHLLSIPEHIRNSVIQKFSLSDYIKFHQSSRKCFDAAKEVKTRFSVEARKFPWAAVHEPLRVRFRYMNEVIVICLFDLATRYRSDFIDFPVRFEGGDGTVLVHLTEEFCVALIKFFSDTNSRMKTFNFWSITCSSESLRKLVEVSKVEKMRLIGALSSNFMSILSIKNEVELVFQRFMLEEQILELHALRFNILNSNITNAGINKILRELLSGSRIIEECTINTVNAIRMSFVLKDIPILRWEPYSSDVIYFGDLNIYRLHCGKRNISICQCKAEMYAKEELWMDEVFF